MAEKKPSEAFLPQYMHNLTPTVRFYGTLKREGNEWVIKAEPQAMTFIRSVFTATGDDAEGEARIPVTERTTADLNWLMMRWPLQLIEPEAYKKEIDKARVKYQETFKVNVHKARKQASLKFKGTLLPFQEHGLAFMIANQKCVLADQMGLGKTVQCLAAIADIQQFPVLIVVPPHLMGQWVSETNRFLGNKVRTHVIQGLKPYPLPEAEVYVIHYLLFRGWAKTLAHMPFNVWVFDEIQELRHNTSKKYKTIKEAVQAVSPEYIFGLSGTPIYNYGIEIFNVFDAIIEGCLGKKAYFQKEWCGGQYGISVKKPDVLGKTLNEQGLMLRRRKEDVLKELPDKVRATQVVDHDDALYIEYLSDAIEAVKALEFAPDIDKMMILNTVQMGVRRACGVAKSQHVAEFVKILLDADEPTLVFAYHHLVVDMLLKYLDKHKPACVTGRQSKEEKSENVKAFMEGRTNVLILNLRTTAGLNLQRARCVVFAELDWSPAIHEQAEDRVHRIGQKKNVVCYYMVSKLSSDLEIAGVLELKKQQFQGIMRDKVETLGQREKSHEKASNFMWAVARSVRKDAGEEPPAIELDFCPECKNPMQKGGLLCWYCGYHGKSDKKRRGK